MRFGNCPECGDYKYLTDLGICPTCEDDSREDIEDILERASVDPEEIVEKLQDN